ncbi:MAG: hypothetical protein COC19_08325 [SAR86 cluster bacterium]|uniref:Phospholipid/glycerol acyltransferase domain-containing protein n=1 Tax=SAR86 cluster bacterium TaxID=2030880 RepID=A0A2A4MGA1_9GAMM|nr:MAG: hypothetical protein COC19_08325 [SAR86 cluster bacterium]
MDQFKEIRPYHDSEIRAVLDSLVDNQEFISSIASFYYPRLTRLMPGLISKLASRRIKKQLEDVHSVKTMQDVIAQYLDKIILDTTSGLSHSGMENLSHDKSYLFISNHRDIVMDPAFVNYVLYHGDFETLQIAIGDNLLKKPFVSDLMRLNKSFIVRRSLKGRELLKALGLLSSYIHYCIASKENVWIAQREGRAKNGIDKTDSALLKMLARGRRDLPLGESLSNLHIVPVAISYEYDACDVLKAQELYQLEQTGEFKKSEHADMDSIVTGMMGFKGHVHIAFGKELEIDSDDPDQIASQIDRQILDNYRLQDSNYLAYEELNKLQTQSKEISDRIEMQELSKSARAEFSRRFEQVDPQLRLLYLSMYANPVISRYKVS